jgi:hypothetical protein
MLTTTINRSPRSVSDSFVLSNGVDPIPGASSAFERFFQMLPIRRLGVFVSLAG